MRKPSPVKIAMLVEFARSVAESTDCLPCCDDHPRPGSWFKLPCAAVDCGCFKCDALRALRCRARGKAASK